MSKKKKEQAAEKLTVVGEINKYRGVIMGVAALMIFLFHHWTVITPSVFPNHPTLGSIPYFLVTHGHTGVDIFFLLSGIGLVWAADKGSVGRFYLRRIKRVYIPFFICYAVLFIVTGQPFLQWIRVVSGYSFLFESMYSVFWFVPAILILYLLFPLYNFILKKLRFPVLVTAVVLVLWYLGSQFLPINYYYFGFYNRIPVFLIGVLLGRLEKDGKFPKSKLFYLAGPVLLALGLFTTYLVENKGVPLLVTLPNCFIPALCLGTGTVFILAFVLDFLHRFRIAGKVADLISVPFSYLGKTSLEFYLVQMFTVRGLLYSDRGIVSVSTGSTLGNDLLILLVAVGLSFVLSTISGLVCRLIPEGRKKG